MSFVGNTYNNTVQVQNILFNYPDKNIKINIRYYKILNKNIKIKNELCMSSWDQSAIIPHALSHSSSAGRFLLNESLSLSPRKPRCAEGPRYNE